MPAPSYSPMCKDLYDKLVHLAGCDDAAAADGGEPLRLNILLRSGREIQNVSLVDGSNSLDDQSIDVIPKGLDRECEWTIVIAEIAAIQTIFPRAK
jgi:hypothetical protein